MDLLKLEEKVLQKTGEVVNDPSGLHLVVLRDLPGHYGYVFHCCEELFLLQQLKYIKPFKN